MFLSPFPSILHSLPCCALSPLSCSAPYSSSTSTSLTCFPPFPWPRAQLPALALHPCFIAVLRTNDLCRHHSNHANRNAQGLADVITQSRAFMSSTAKAKTAKLSEYCVIFVFFFVLDSNPICFGCGGATVPSLSRHLACSRCRRVYFGFGNLHQAEASFLFILILLHPLLISPFLFLSFPSPNNKY